MNNTFYREDNLSGLRRADFQKTVQGKETDLFILSNDKGVEVAVTNYGGAILAVMVPDKNGNLGNVVQGHDSIDKVINSPEPFLSTLVGRYGNRICKGKFMLDGKEYTLAINNGPNSLHGGPTGFHARVWDAIQASKDTLVLTYVSADGEEGFPGNLRVEVVYRLTEFNELILSYKATTDKRTLVNLTHHAFFSLSGLANPTQSVENNILTINADYYTPVDSTFMTTGEMLALEGNSMDFRNAKPIADALDMANEQVKFGMGIDHNYVLNTKGNIEEVAAKLVCPSTGISLEVYTDEPGIQVYTGNFLDGSVKGKKGMVYNQRAAICMETQHYPDSPNKPQWPSVILEPGQTYQSHCIFKFGVEK